MTANLRKGPFPETKAHLRDGAVIALTLACVDALLLRFWFSPRLAVPMIELWPAALVSVAASAAYLLIASPFPELLFRSRFVFPMALVAPLVRSVFMMLISALGTTAPVGIERAPDAVQPALLWLDMSNLCISGLAGLIALVALFPLLGVRNPRDGSDR